MPSILWNHGLLRYYLVVYFYKKYHEAEKIKEVIVNNG